MRVRRYALLLIIVCAPEVQAGVNEWTTHGPPGLTAFAMAPGPPEMLFASSGDGIFRSSDHGETWTLTSRVFTGIQPPPAFLTVDAADSSTLYVSATEAGPGTFSMGVWKSPDSGATWHGASQGLPFPLNVDQLEAVPGALYLVTVGVASGIYKSVDGASTWTLVSPDRPPGKIFIDAGNPSRMYAVSPGADFELFKSNDEGRTWSLAKGDGAPQNYGIVSLAIDPLDFSTIHVGIGTYATSAILESLDAGETWSLTTANLRSGGWGAYALAAVPSNSAVLYVSISEPPSPPEIHNPRMGGLYQSVDGGDWWIRLSDFGANTYLLTDRSGRFLYNPTIDGVEVFEVEGERMPVQRPAHRRHETRLVGGELP
jgi:photosystem II stability/assembly factor-like uncharacterized protein